MFRVRSFHLILRVALYRVLPAILVFFVLGFYVLPLRNFVLRPVWPKGWRHLSSEEVIMMNRDYTVSEVPNATAKLKCARMAMPNKTFATIHLAPLQPYPSDPTKVALKEESHRIYFPIITDEEKRDLLLLYTILSEALNRAHVKHFLVDGSLLGAARHNGFIPWDDDIDIVINVLDWQKVLHTLSCIQGYKIVTNTVMHWKFAHLGHGYPYIDVFFYTENDKYLWAVTHYIKNNLVFPKDKVFPLKTVKFEDLQAPVPNQLKETADLVFDLEVCKSQSVNHKTGYKYEEKSIPCSSLTYLYPMLL